MAYFERWPVYESEVGRSVRLYEVVPRVVTVREEPRFYWHLIPAWPNTLPVHWTVFNEVSIVEPKETWSVEVKDFVLESQSIKREAVSVGEFAQISFQAMKDAIERAWKPERFHFVLHSAGWDSRLMSLAMWALYQERGEDWLGDVLFVECANEAKGFKQVMQLGGWQEAQCVVYREGIAPDEYHARSLNFETAWQRMDGGMRPYPFNMWWDPVGWAQEQGLVPGDEQLQCWSGFTANWVGRMTVQGIISQEELSSIPRNALSACPLKAGWVFPYADLDFMRTLLRFGKGQRPHQVIGDVVICLMPEQSQIENPVDVRYRALSKGLFQKALCDYQRSWYAQRRPGRFGELGNDLPRALDYDRQWGHWGLASFCEYLREKGHTVQVE